MKNINLIVVAPVIVMTMLKVANVIDWSWWIVTITMWFPIALILAIVPILFLMGFKALTDVKKTMSRFMGNNVNMENTEETTIDIDAEIVDDEAFTNQHNKDNNDDDNTIIKIE